MDAEITIEVADSLRLVLGMQFSKRERLEIEDRFLLDFSILVHPRNDFVSFGRWVAAQRGTGLALMFAAVKYALRQNFSRSLSCSKPDVINFVRSNYGLRFDTLTLPINFSSIPLCDKAYFSESPCPRLCTGSLEQWYDSLKPRVASLIKIMI
ncbi:MAG: hypothetical protein NVSMB66_7520 [Candidatus Doudnabacteria bacterium]